MNIWFERGMRKKPKGYEIMKMFPPHSFLGFSANFAAPESYDIKSEMHLLSKFYYKYPEVKYFPTHNNIVQEFGGTMRLAHPAIVFIRKQKDLLKKGYTEDKAFSLVEEELGSFLNKQREEMRVLRGVALNIHGDSYLDRMQKIAEVESTLKVSRYERDIPKYQRAQEEWMDSMNKSKQSQGEEDVSYQRRGYEDVFKTDFQAETKAAEIDLVNNYQPVLYEVVKDKSLVNQKESLSEIQEGFLNRTENLLKIFHERAHIHDGLKNMSDEEVLRKVRESPTKLKRAAKNLLVKLRKHNVTLDNNGDVNFSIIKEQNIVSFIKNNETLVKLTLMQADLEFEYPQKLEKMTIKADILKLVEEEEVKMKQIAGQKEYEELQKKVLTYEEYYDASPAKETTLFAFNQNALGESRKDTKFEDFALEKQSANMFDNDLLDQAYKFWETDEDKAERLKKIWIDLKRKNAIGGIDQRTTEEQDQMSTQIVELTRRVRFRIDQELTRRSITPLFKDNYRTYDKEEFLLDADLEFFKIKKLLEKNPKVLKEDPILGVDYLRIINLIKRKRLYEDASDQYDPRDSLVSTYLDADQVKAEKYFDRMMEEKRFIEQFDTTMSGVGSGSADNLGLEDEETEASVRSSKKKEEREKTKLLKQFDALAVQFEKSNKAVTNQAKTESAGHLKRSNKKKKEKTLSSKLRLKEKKGGPEK